MLFHSGKHIARVPSLDITIILLQEMPIVVHPHTTGCVGVMSSDVYVVHPHTTGCVGVMSCVVIPQDSVITELYHSHVC